MSPNGQTSEGLQAAYAEAMARWAEAVDEVMGSAAATGASETLLKLFATQQEARSQTMERWAQAMEEMVGTEGFAAASSQMLTLYAQQQQALREASKAAAESMHIPTTDDLAAVSQLVVNVERKVDEATELLAAVLARPEPGDQLAAVAARLEAIEERLAELSSAAAAATPAKPATPRKAAAKPAAAKAARPRAARARSPKSGA